jgi:N utilization substance protein A
MEDNRAFLEALDQVEKEKDISKDVLIEAIENSLLAASKNQFGTSDNIRVKVDRKSGEINVIAEKIVSENVETPAEQISFADAKVLYPKRDFVYGDMCEVVITPKEFGRISVGKAKQAVVQKVREEERKALYTYYADQIKELVVGAVTRYVGRNIAVTLDKTEAILAENEQVRGEKFRVHERAKFYVLDVHDTPKGPRINISRTHPELVKKLFETEVTEVKDGIVEVRAIAREAGARTKMAVSSNDPNVDPVGACVGYNGSRVNAVVDELRGEKIDIIHWDDDIAVLIKNALSPAKVVSVEITESERSALVVVPNNQLSLAIGREGQNARLAAKLTGFKIDIKSEEQAGFEDNFFMGFGAEDEGAESIGAWKSTDDNSFIDLSGLDKLLSKTRDAESDKKKKKK